MSKINQQSLNEIRNYQQPPSKVKMTIEAVMLIMKGVKLDWAEIRKIMGKSDFIEGVLGFNVDQLKEKVKQTVIQEYLNNSEWDIEAIY